MDLKNIVEEYKNNVIEISKKIGQAKRDMKKKEYRAFIDESGLSKDQVSMSLKRFFLLEFGFTETDLSEFADKQVKKMTTKLVKTTPALVEALGDLRDRKKDYEEFLMLLDMYKVVKTDDEKALTKTKSFVKCMEESDLKTETMQKISGMISPFVITSEEG